MRGFMVKALKPKFRVTARENPCPRHILDIGIENDSYREAKAVYPQGTYHGLDIVPCKTVPLNNDRFFVCDLEQGINFEAIPDGYDLILINHVLEHLSNGEVIFTALCGMLRPGGILYAEFPSIRTAMRRKTRFNYHFHDDPTHKRFYPLEKLANIAIGCGGRVVSCGPVSTPTKSIISAPRAIFGALTGKGYGPYLLHAQGKIDHIMVRRSSPSATPSKYIDPDKI